MVLQAKNLCSFSVMAGSCWKIVEKKTPDQMNSRKWKLALLFVNQCGVLFIMHFNYSAGSTLETVQVGCRQMQHSLFKILKYYCKI